MRRRFGHGLLKLITVLLPLAAGCIILGVQPGIIIDGTAASVADTLAAYPAIIEQASPHAGGILDTMAMGGGR